MCLPKLLLLFPHKDCYAVMCSLFPASSLPPVAQAGHALEGASEKSLVALRDLDCRGGSEAATEHSDCHDMLLMTPAPGPALFLRWGADAKDRKPGKGRFKPVPLWETVGTGTVDGRGTGAAHGGAEGWAPGEGI